MKPDDGVQALIHRYGLESVLSRVWLALRSPEARAEGVAKIQVTEDEWSEPRPRLLVTVSFDAPLLEARERWKRLRPLVTPHTRGAERAGQLGFHYGGSRDLHGERDIPA